MQSKYEIVLQKTTNVIFNEHDFVFTGLSKAMDEYAKQECMQYAKFINNTEWELSNQYQRTLTDEELYFEYLQSKHQNESLL